MAKIPNKQTMGLKDPFSFGKYKGVSLDDVLTMDADYVQWLIEQTDRLLLNNEAYTEYEQVIKDKNL